MRWVAGEGEIGDDESTEVRWFPVDALPELSEFLATSMGAAIDDRPECRLVVNGVDLPIVPARGA